MRKRYFLSAGLGVAVAVISQLPMAWIAPLIFDNDLGPNVSYSGTVWDGYAFGLEFIGAAALQISPSAFFGDGTPISFQTRSDGMSISGQASQKELKDIRFAGVLAKLPTRDGRLKDLAGTVDIRIDDLQIKDESCTSAWGIASTDFLTLNRARWQWQGPEISGPISCEDGDLLASLSGNESRQRIRADLRLSADGSYSADITVQTDQPEAGVVLPLYGFEAVGRDYKLTERGQWR